MIFYTHERNFGCRVMEYTYRGLPTISLENELLRVTVLAGKGGDIFEFLYKPLDVDFMWRSPWGVRDPASFVATSHTAASAFLDFYLEPFSTAQADLVDAIADCSAHSLAPGETWGARFVAVAYSGISRVASIAADGTLEERIESNSQEESQNG